MQPYSLIQYNFSYATLQALEKQLQPQTGNTA